MTEKKSDATEKKQQEVTEIDLVELFRKLMENRKKICKAVGIGALIGLVIGFSLPKNYEVKVSLSPESGLSSSSSLSGIVSMLGLSGSTNGEDALSFTLFPEIIKTTPFLVEMLETPIETENGDRMTLYDYLDTQKKPWWGYVLGLPGHAIRGIMSLFMEKPEMNESQTIDLFRLTEEQSMRIEMLGKLLEAKTDKNTSITTVSISLQDPIAAALVADSAVTKLQRYITNYRIRKAEQDCNYLARVCEECKIKYIKAQEEYANFTDANKNIIMQSVKAESERLEKAVNVAYQIYSQMETQLQLSRANVEESKPVFAVVEPATIPLRPSSPGKMFIMIGFMFLAFFAESAWILFGKDLWTSFKKEIKTSNEKIQNDNK